MHVFVYFPALFFVRERGGLLVSLWRVWTVKKRVWTNLPQGQASHEWFVGACC